MNLVEQIFQQAQAGSAQGQGFGQFFAEGVQQGQRQQQLAMEIAQAPLKQTLLQQDAAINAAKLHLLLQQRDDTAKATQAFAGLAAQVSPLLQAGKTDEAQLAMIDAGVNNSFLANDPRFKNLYDFTSKSQDAKLELLKAKEFTTPEVKTVTDEKGNSVLFAREGLGSWKPMQENTIEVKTPEGTIVRQSTGAAGRPANFGLQPAVTADVEKKLAANDQSLSLLDQSVSLISPTTVGPVGAATEQLEKLANIAKPGSMDPAATRARQTFRITAQQQYNALKADSQINKMEAAALESIADITRLNESDPTAREKYNTLRDLTALRSVLLNHQLGKFAPDTALRAMSLAQVARAWKRKDMTDAEVERWNEIHQLVK